MKVLGVVGARPNFMKMAPVLDALRGRDGVETFLVHTGQHYDERMSALFFGQLGLPRPDVDLGVGSGPHAAQTAEVMKRIDPVLEREVPDVVVVVGDVNSTLAAALAAVKRGIPVAHVEAGLRSYDRGMPEEINRVLTDQISDLLFVTEKPALGNLAREGIPAGRAHFVGNAMIDTLIKHRDRAGALDMPGRLGFAPRGYGVVTLHRPSNVDDPGRLGSLLDLLGGFSWDVPLVFPVHPRTKAHIEAGGLSEKIAAHPGLRLTAPLGYLEFLGLVDGARAVLTDSGGIQEETTVLGVPCLTLRENTERPATVTEGTNRIVGCDPARIRSAWRETLSRPMPAGRVPDLWDGKAGVRIANVLTEWHAARNGRNADQATAVPVSAGR